MASPLPNVRVYFADENGAPLVGGKVYTYAAGSGTPKATYTTKAATVENTNPVVLDARGEADIWLGDGGYKIVVKNSADVLRWERDNIESTGDLEKTILDQLAAANGSSLVGFQQSGTGSATRTVEEKARETRTITDKDGADTTGATSSRTALVNAIADLTSGGEVILPPGTYLIDSEIVPTVNNIALRGAGKGATVIKIAASYANSTALFKLTNLSGWSFSGITFDGYLSGQSISSTTDNKQIAIQLTGTTNNIDIDNCHFKDWGKDGVYVGGASVARINVRNSRFENIRRIGVTVIGGEQIHVENCQFYLGKDQSNVVFNNGVHYEPNSSSDTLKCLIVKGCSFHDMQGGVMLWNSNSATASGVTVEGCEFETITQRAAMIAYAMGTSPVIFKGNRARNCGNSSSSSIERDGGGIGFGNSVAHISSCVFENCTGYYGTVVNDGAAGRGSQIKDNTFIGDLRRGIYLGYVFNGGTLGSLRQITGNTMLGGGQESANTYAAIEIVNVSSHNGSGDRITGNAIQISTSSGYNAGIKTTYDDGSSIVGHNTVNGSTGTKYTFTNGTPTQLYDYSRDASVTIDPISLADGAGESIDVTVSGAAVGDQVIFAPGVSLQGITASVHVRGANTVQIRLQNETGGTIDLASSTWYVKTIRRLT